MSCCCAQSVCISVRMRRSRRPSFASPISSARLPSSSASGSSCSGKARVLRGGREGRRAPPGTTCLIRGMALVLGHLRLLLDQAPVRAALGCLGGGGLGRGLQGQVEETWASALPKGDPP